MPQSRFSVAWKNLGFDDCFRYYSATPQLNDCDAGGPFMKNYNWISKLTVLLFPPVNLAVATGGCVGGGYDYSRSALMGSSGVTVFRAAYYGKGIVLTLSS